ncbi:MAG: hypothetical protein ACREP0_03645, partial [Rhodanobacteraceae bacterium]
VRENLPRGNGGGRFTRGGKHRADRDQHHKRRLLHCLAPNWTPWVKHHPRHGGCAHRRDGRGMRKQCWMLRAPWLRVPRHELPANGNRTATIAAVAESDTQRKPRNCLIKMAAPDGFEPPNA